jgi:hypothetical protein
MDNINLENLDDTQLSELLSLFEGLDDSLNEMEAEYNG